MIIKTALYNLIFFLRATTLIAPIIILFYQHNGLSAQELFLFQGIFYLVSLLMEVPVGYLSNKLPKKNLLIFSLLIYLITLIVWLNFQGYFVVLIGEIVFAISKIILDNSMSGYLYEYLKSNGIETEMSQKFSYLNFYLALGTVFASILAPALYSQSGISQVIIVEIYIITLATLLLTTMPTIKILKNKKREKNAKQNLAEYAKTLKYILKESSIKYHIFLSGILTSCSIFFVLSFQPLLQNSSLPIIFFGITAFLNHGIRGIASIVAGKFATKINITKLAQYCCYTHTTAFILLLLANCIRNRYLIIIAITITCVIIGLQLIFTVLHISRAHSLIRKECRGSLMAINNLFSRAITAFILISSNTFMKTPNSTINYYIIALIAFSITAVCITKKIRKLDYDY